MLRRRFVRLVESASRPGLFRGVRLRQAALLCLIAAACLSICAVPPAAADPAKSVLVLTSESMSMPGAALVVNGTVSALRAWRPVNIFVESLDRSRFPSDTEGLAFLQQRYRDRRLDLVVTVCAPALDFALRHRDELFPGAAILFSFVSRSMVKPFGPAANMSGVFVDPDYDGLIGLALKFHPGARKLFVVGGASEFDRGWLASFAQTTAGPTLSRTYLADKPLGDLLGELATVPDDAVILYQSVSRDTQGVTYVPREVLDMIRRVSQVPIYGISSTYLGHGAVGGPVFDLQAHADDVGRMAVRVLSGEPAGSLRAFATANMLAFDSRELQRFGINESALPAGATVLYRERPFWAIHRGWVIATVLLILGQTVLIATMLAHRRKRTGLQASLATRLRFETMLSDVSTALGGAPMERMEATIRAALGMIRRYFGVDRVSLFELTSDGRIVRTAYDEADGGESPQPEAYGIADLPAITITLAALQPFVVDRLDDLPEEADREREVLSAAAVKSLAMVPLEVGGRSLGALSCVSLRAERKWPSDAVQQVRTLGQVIANVIERRQTDAAVRQSDRLKGAILSSIPAHITVLDRTGVIITVNDAWLAFARANGVRGEASVSPGANYLQVCERAAAEGSPGAAEALAGVKAVCEGHSDSFELDYACAGPDLKRWFAMKVLPLRRPEGGALVMHRDTTSQKQQELVLRELTGRLINAQEDERRRIARELHDDLQQRLALVAIELDGIALGVADLAPDDVADRARDLWRQANEISAELHNLSHRLHPTKLEALGLLPTVQAYCRELAKAGLNVTLRHDGVPRDMCAEVALCVFRIVQESLQNVLKHSGASEAGVTMTADDDTLRLVVSDGGRGFEANAAFGGGGGLGLVSMRERLHLVGGTMTIRSVPGGGTSMEFQVPLRVDDSASPEGATLQQTGI